MGFTNKELIKVALKQAIKSTEKQIKDNKEFYEKQSPLIYEKWDEKQKKYDELLESYRELLYRFEDDKH